MTPIFRINQVVRTKFNGLVEIRFIDPDPDHLGRVVYHVQGGGTWVEADLRPLTEEEKGIAVGSNCPVCKGAGELCRTCSDSSCPYCQTPLLYRLYEENNMVICQRCNGTGRE